MFGQAHWPNHTIGSLSSSPYHHDLEVWCAFTPPLTWFSLILDVCLIPTLAFPQVYFWISHITGCACQSSQAGWQQGPRSRLRLRKSKKVRIGQQTIGRAEFLAHAGDYPPGTVTGGWLVHYYSLNSLHMLPLLRFLCYLQPVIASWSSVDELIFTLLIFLILPFPFHVYMYPCERGVYHI